MLARILDERRLTGTPLGAVATACAAVDDVTAWCLLLLAVVVVVVVIVKAEALVSAAWTIALALDFIVLMLDVIRPLVARALRLESEAEAPSKRLTAGVLIFVFVSALLTEAIGIHALFGARSWRAWRYRPQAAWAASCANGSWPSARCSCCRCFSRSPACAPRSGC